MYCRIISLKQMTLIFIQLKHDSKELPILLVQTKSLQSVYIGPEFS